MKPMETVGVYAHINRAYEASQAYQWSREAVVNALQAGATDIRFDVEWQGVIKQKVYRQLIADNGCGMQAHQMPAFLNKFGGSGRIIGEITGNYGVGFKTSVLPWNYHGVVVLSVVTVDGAPVVNMMWLKREASKKGEWDYGARELIVDYFTGKETDASDEFVNNWSLSFGKNEDATTVLPLSYLKAEGYSPVLGGINWLRAVPSYILKAGHGTAVVLMGAAGKEHTMMGDTGREEDKSKYGLCRYLNTRFYSLPKDVKISVTSMGSEGTAKDWNQVSCWPGKPGEGGISGRTVIGMRKCLESYEQVALKNGKQPQREITALGGSLTIPVQVETWLLPELAKSSGTQGGNNSYLAGNYPSLPVIASLYVCHDELPELVEAFDVRMLGEGNKALYNWINLDSIRKRMAITLEPKDLADVHVFADQSRRTLLYTSKTKGGTPLPEVEWADAYKLVRPSFLTKAIQDYFASLSADIPEVDGKIIEHLKQYYPYMAVTVLEKRRGRKVVPVAEDEAAEDEDEDEPVSGRGGARLPRIQAPRNGREFEVKVGLIEVKKARLESGFPVEWNEDQGRPCGLVDVTHPLIQDAWAMCELRLKADCVNDGNEMESYRKAFEAQVAAHVSLALTHIQTWLKANKMKYKDQITKPEALIAVVAGIRHLHQAVQGQFGTIKGGRAKAFGVVSPASCA